MGFGQFTYNGHNFDASSINAVKVPATRKQKIGQNIIQNQVFSNSFDYRITIQGNVRGNSTTLDTARTNLENSQNGFKAKFTDGIGAHAGSYVVQSLIFHDNANDNTGLSQLPFTLVLIQDQFTGGTS